MDLLAKMDLIFVDPPYLNSSYGDYSVGEGEISPEDFKILDSYCSFLYKKYEVCSIICNYETEMDNELYVGSTNIVSYVSTRSMNLNRYTKRRFNYVLYGFGNSLL